MLLAARLREVADLDDQLIQDFVHHPVLARLGAMPRAYILDILLQRRFISFAFTPMYELALDVLTDAKAQAALRELLRAEYADSDGSTHREKLMMDLAALGATRSLVLRSRVSGATLDTIRDLLAMMMPERPDEHDELDQLTILSALRLAGEVLVAAEYTAFWPHLERLGLSAEKRPGSSLSAFYYPHLVHDSRAHRLDSDPRPGIAHGHADVLSEHLREMLLRSSNDGLASCMQAMQRAQRIKKAFYDQWL